jgi:DNA invertase Pin-like site-specific DNA recombinase
MEKKFIRCAVYTRKSCEDGLEQEFNSLDAQRLAGENFVASQIHENWRLVSKHYDDGGFSGGNMNRPALKELFEDIKAGLIDMVVVYKIDRLSRSLFDFSKIVELFDKYNVSFVSVTQSFNTSISSGKLMLNILLSFAQYERELSSERIRDKFAASLKKGMWMGGVPPLEYTCKDRKLIINEKEAKIMKFIYDKFLQTESYLEVAGILNAAGYRTRPRNENTPGKKFEPKAILRMLRNPYYKGCVVHKENVYPGEHEAIIEESIWNQVQEIFKKHERPGQKEHKTTTPSFLKGLVYCGACNVLMRKTCSNKRGLQYRYYTCSNHLRYKSCEAAQHTIPAEIIEKRVVEEIVRILKSPEVVMGLNHLAERRKDVSKTDLMTAIKNLNDVWGYLYQAEQRKIIHMLINKIVMHEDGVKIDLNLEGFDSLIMRLI